MGCSGSLGCLVFVAQAARHVFHPPHQNTVPASDASRCVGNVWATKKQSRTAAAVPGELHHEHCGPLAHRVVLLLGVERGADARGPLRLHVLLQHRLGAAHLRGGGRG